MAIGTGIVSTVEYYCTMMAHPDDHHAAEASSSNDREDKLLLVWERAIETQMHFAELSIKTRQVGMTVVGASLGLAVVLYRAGSGYSLNFRYFELPIFSVLCWAAAIVLFAIWSLDVRVYHQMLRGAVAFNEELERNNLLGLFGTAKGLTEAISFFSRHPVACTRFRRHRVRCFDGAGGGSWRDGSLPANSSLRLCG